MAPHAVLGSYLWAQLFYKPAITPDVCVARGRKGLQSNWELDPVDHLSPKALKSLLFSYSTTWIINWHLEMEDASGF